MKINRNFWVLPESPQAVLVSAFITIILTGAIILSRPFVSTGSSLSFIDALFTSASATCVTGLIVADTGSAFNSVGQIIILILIQVGGLGVMSFSTLFLYSLKGRLDIGSREIMKETLILDQLQDTGRILKAVFKFAFIFEAFGTVMLTLRFVQDMPFQKALYTAVFHSVSAFCNAGFSTFSESLMGYRSDVFINVVMMFLIIAGGIGFIVIYELFRLPGKNFSFHDLSLHSRVVLIYTGFLIMCGAVIFFIFEYNVSMVNESIPSKILASFFQSVTARTAGFNTIDISAVSFISLFTLIILMFIGASPASCGGGIKTATLAVVFAFIISKIKDTKNVNIFFRTLPFKVVSKAIVIIVFGIVTVMLFVFLISVAEHENVPFSDNGIRFIRLFFEVVSAFGTVGLSTGITAQLSDISRILLTLLMLIGRVGPLTLAIVVASKAHRDIHYAHENLLVG